MLNQLTIYLQAIHPEQNVYRQYEIYIGQDLFGSWVLTTAYGRVGTGRHMKSYAFDSQQGMIHKLMAIIKKRLSSYARIGVNYHVTKFIANDQSLIPEEFLQFLEERGREGQGLRR